MVTVKRRKQHPEMDGGEKKEEEKQRSHAPSVGNISSVHSEIQKLLIVHRKQEQKIKPFSKN